MSRIAHRRARSTGANRNASLHRRRRRRRPSLNRHPTAIATAAPVFNRANELMPSWLRVRGEFRERFEGFENGNFIEGRDDAYALSRFRFNVAVTANQHLAFQANLQDARVADKEVGPTTAPFRGPFDLRTAFADVGDAKAR